ncbi:MAG TPA: hypothetical protein VK498_07060, partial [Ferruginibacter sp.]|nr:hypothetical protein [Ferruginibacter sp.]
MKLYLAIISICFLGISVHAQQNHFVYLQTDNKQPFYVQVNEKVFSSSATGYVVIPKLVNGSYTFNIGFPKNEWPQQNLPVTINNKDAGYLLKNFESKGWGLFDMQTMNVIMPAASVSKSEPTENKTDAFSNVLADVVNTPSLKEKPKEEVPVKKEEPVVKKEEPVIEKVAQVAIIPADYIKKISSDLDKDGRAMVFVDQSATSRDTVRIFIPYEEATVLAEAKTVISETEIKPLIPVPDTNKAGITVNTADHKTDTKFINIELPNPNTTSDTAKIVVSSPAEVVNTNKSETKSFEKPVINNQVSTVQMINSDCKNLATEEDFLKARKKMVGESNDDEMIAVARKIFKARCYSTEQVKNLSVLFLK